MSVKWCLGVIIICICLIMVMSSIISDVYGLIFSSSANCPVPLPSLPLGCLFFSPWFVVILCIFWQQSFDSVWFAKISQSLLVHYVPDQIEFFTLTVVKYQMFSLGVVLSGSLKKSFTALKVKWYFSYIFF